VDTHKPLFSLRDIFSVEITPLRSQKRFPAKIGDTTFCNTETLQHRFTIVLASFILGTGLVSSHKLSFPIGEFWWCIFIYGCCSKVQPASRSDHRRIVSKVREERKERGGRGGEEENTLILLHWALTLQQWLSSRWSSSSDSTMQAFIHHKYKELH